MEGIDMKVQEPTPTPAPVILVWMLDFLNPCDWLVCQWFFYHQAFIDVVPAVLVSASIVYLPLLQDIAARSLQRLLHLIAPVTRSILSQVDGDAAEPLPQGLGFVAPTTTAQV